uniref:Uncharacterized protein n=1 Tax=Anguilla anguilla TaxID=7936 RepID=A0A0E9T5I6_ANGAN
MAARGARYLSRDVILRSAV